MRLRVTRMLLWTGRLTGLAIAGACMVLFGRLARPHLWLQILLIAWTVPFIPVGWASGSLIARLVIARWLGYQRLRRRR